ncbi:MAG: cytochrome b/b6 domain-containing protein [Chloroflexota bacterium]|nr:cytochrome b/b6 domain-containing protein [Chloroflexota bacterium]MDE2884333.1 cytochrome b/b6 domain-containing protein [Chloroflexota bacterium]
MSEGRSAYNPITQILHWASALLILGMLALGLAMTRIGEGEAQETLYNAHVAMGIGTLVLTALRLVALAVHRWPSPPPGLSRVNERAFIGTHVLLYALLIALLGSGIAMLAFSGIALAPGSIVPADVEDVPPRMAHNLLSKVFIALLVVHVAGVVRYQLGKGDTLGRMGVHWFRRGA